jgi:hypothetical protein
MVMKQFLFIIFNFLIHFFVYETKFQMTTSITYINLP